MLGLTSGAFAADSTPPALSFCDVEKKVEAAGYTQIKEMEYEHDSYKVKALDAQSNKAKLHVNASTGEIQAKSKSKHDEIMN